MQQCAGFQIRQKELMSSGDQNAFYLEWKESNRWWALYILPISTLLAKTGKKDTWSLISIKKPQIVNDYNADMRGVDKLDQLIRSYNILMKCVHRLNTLLLLHGHLSCRHSLSTHPSTLHKCTFGSAGLPDGAWPTDSLTSCRVCRPPPTPKQLHPKRIKKRNKEKWRSGTIAQCVPRSVKLTTRQMSSALCATFHCCTISRNYFTKWHECHNGWDHVAELEKFFFFLSRALQFAVFLGIEI